MGSTEAQYRLGMFYAFGRGVPASRPWAAALFSQAATQGHAQAAAMLETIQLASLELPPCVSEGTAPQRLPPPAPPQVNGLQQMAAVAGAPSLEAVLQGLPASRRWVVPLATTLSDWYALDPRLVLSVIAVESNFHPGARSPKAAMGLMQLIPETAERFNVRDAYNATQNLRGGMAYLRWLLSYYRGHIAYALAAYNAGEGRVDRYRGVPPFPETQAYVRRVIGLYGRWRHGFDEGLADSPPWLAAGGR
jgi:soluble lytic murein transglycosylase-like protein